MVLDRTMALRTWKPATGEARARDRSEDLALAARIADGDGAAFEALVERWYGHVSRIVGRFFRRQEIAEEVRQDVFVKVYSKIDSYRGEMPLEHWLARVAVNACYDQLRRDARRPETPIADLTDDAGEFFDRLRAAPGRERDAFWEREEARLTAERLLETLAPAERLVLTLMVLEERSVAEVAELTGWSRANVKVRAFRARGRLRKTLDGYERRSKER